MQHRLLTLVAALGAACLPPANNAGELGSTDSGSADSGSSAGETATGQSTGQVEATSSTGDDGSGSTTGVGVDDPCLAFPPETCPAECAVMVTYSQWERSCEVALLDEVALCVSSGEPLDPDEPTTFYAEIDGEIRYLIHAQECVDEPPASPVTFTECTGAPGEPELCQCLCNASGCPYEAEFFELEACGLELPCGEIVINDIGSPTDYDLCVLAALRDRVPGAYASYHNTGLFLEETRVYFGGGDEAQIVHRQADDLFCSVLEGTWEPALACTLKPPAWFQECIDGWGTTVGPECLLGESWFEACTEQPPSCP